MFPPDCANFSGPHSDECLNEIWQINGCTEDGNKNFAFQSQELKEVYRLQDLRYII